VLPGIAVGEVNLLGGGVVGGFEEFRFDAALDGERAPCFFLACFASGFPCGVLAERFEGFLSSVLRLMSQEIEQGLIGLGLTCGLVEIALVVDAMLREQGEGVIAEASIEVGEEPWRGSVSAHLEHTSLREVAGSDCGGIVGGFEEDLVDLRDDSAIGFGFLRDGLPFWVGEERLPRGVAGGAIGVGEQVDELVIFVIERDPVTDVLDPVFGEELERMIAEAGVEVVEFSGGRVIDPDFETAGVFGCGLGQCGV